MTITISGSGNPLDVNGTNTGFYSTLMSSQTTTTGTFKDFTGIPSWVKKITVLLNGMSTSGTNFYLVQLGTSSGIITTGYSSGASSNGAGSSSSTAGFILNASTTAAGIIYATVFITNFSGTQWISSGVFAASNANQGATSGGSVDAGATVDRIRITTVNGTDTFDLGAVNVLYE